jgi:hypothetical protein
MATPLLDARNQLHKLGYMAVFLPFSNSRSVETCSAAAEYHRLQETFPNTRRTETGYAHCRAHPNIFPNILCALLRVTMVQLQQVTGNYFLCYHVQYS